MGGGGGQPWDTPLVHPEHVRNLPFFKKLFHADFQGWKWFNTVTPKGRAGNFFIAVGLMGYMIGSSVASSKRKHQAQLDLKRADRKARHDREAYEKLTGKKQH